MVERIVVVRTRQMITTNEYNVRIYDPCIKALLGFFLILLL